MNKIELGQQVTNHPEWDYSETTCFICAKKVGTNSAVIYLDAYNNLTTAEEANANGANGSHVEVIGATCKKRFVSAGVGA